ncbi:MAG: PadR family transcriptional regulator [Leptolinea sp.]
MASRSNSSLQVESILLGLLSKAPLHGYDLYKSLRQPGGLSLVWRINQSNLYAILDKLEKDGYLTSEYIIVDNSHPRKDFRITAKGIDCFQQWMREPVQTGREMRQIFMAKLYFALKDDLTTAEQLVDAQYLLGIQWKNDIQSNLDELLPEQEYERLVFQSRIFQVSAWLQLLDTCKGVI